MKQHFERVRRALRHSAARDPSPQLGFALRLADGGQTIDVAMSRAATAPKSAAILLLISDPDSPKVTLIRRSNDGGVHSGQFAFPGGSREDHDRSLQHTALREAHEELGLEPRELEVIGELASVYVPPSNFVVTPFVALHHGRPRYVPDAVEVDDVFEAPLDAFFERGAIASETWLLRGCLYEVPFYRLGERKIWGATARMLAMLVAAVRCTEPLNH